MSIWFRMGEYVSAAATQALSAVVESVRTVFEGDPLTRRHVGFSIAMIALSAKMAKADGIVTSEEVEAFQELFEVPESEAENVARVYNLAKRDVSGFDGYANRIRQLFPDDSEILRDVLDGLFHIAKADGLVHELEMNFIDEVAKVLGIGEGELERIRLRHLHPEDGNPYLLLGADPAWDDKTLKRHYRKLVADNHPDRMIARGVPEEFLKISNDRLACINKVWAHIRAERDL